MTLSFEERLDRYAEVLVRVGVNVQPGQRLLLCTDLTAAPLARRIARHAYDAGATLVNTVWDDAESTRVRFRHAAPSTLDDFPEWQARLWQDTAERGDAYLYVKAEDPGLLADIDAALVARDRRARQVALRPFSRLLRKNAFAWCRASAPTLPWATRVFPDLPPQAALERLWNDVFRVTRVDEPDPVAAGWAHMHDLERRAQALDARRYHAVHFRGPGTDLYVGLADRHVWVGGASLTPSGVPFAANVPTEELFTAPHRERVHGTVRATKPLSLSGTIVDGIEMRFEGGRIVEARASRGEDVLLRALDADDGARFLGEVALVSNRSPVAATNTLFLDTLFDENAACHIAFGASYGENFERGNDLTPEEIAALGGNDSITHVDFMIGGADVDVDGVREDGTREALLRSGDWAF